MKTGFLASLLIPPEFLLPLLTLAGFVLMIGMRKLAAGIITTVLVIAFAPMFDPLFDELFASMPPWFSWLALAAIGIAILGSIVGFRFIRDVASHVVGDLIASSLKWLFVAPFRLVSWVISLFFRTPGR